MIKLHHAKLEQYDKGTDIKEQVYTINDFKNILFTSLIQKDYQCVHLIVVREEKEEDVPIFVDEGEINCILFIEQYVDAIVEYDIYFDKEKDIYVFIQEYPSYQDAYSVALSMKETSPLCYNKDECKSPTIEIEPK